MAAILSRPQCVNVIVAKLGMLHTKLLQFHDNWIMMIWNYREI